MAAAIASLPCPPAASSQALSSSADGGAIASGERNSCFRQLLSLRSRIHPFPSIQTVKTWAQSGFSRTRRYSKLTYGGRSFLKGEQTVYFMIRRLVCVCKGDRRRRQKVCHCCEKGSEENVGVQIVCVELLQQKVDELEWMVGRKVPIERVEGLVPNQAWLARPAVGDRLHSAMALVFSTNTCDIAPVNANQHKAVEQPYGIPERRVPDRWDVVGLGQAMVDFSGTVGDGFLENLGLIKGTRKVVNHEERGKVLHALDGCSYKLSAGGSLSNTLVALARLGIATSQSFALNVAMTGSVGSDALGDFYRTKLLRANVHFLSQPIDDGTTGTVIVLTTPDAQRTMLSYQGMSSIVNFDASLAGAISKSRVLVVEGYLWEIPQTIEAIAQACEAARQQGVLVALTASDVSCVTRYRQQFWDVMCESADILFANCDEAAALCGFGEDSTPEESAMHLSQFCPLVSVTDGARGSYIGLKGEIVFVPPATCVPVDTCGAGDAYAAGVLYGLLRGVPDLKGMGNLAARVAATVVGQQGTRLREEDALELTESVNSLSTLLGTRILELMGMKGEVGSEKISNV